MKRFFSKRFVLKMMVLILTMTVFVSFAYSIVKAKVQKKYEVYGPDITEFKVSGNKLLVKAVKEYNGGIKLNGKSTNIKKLSLKLSKDCKWSQSTPGLQDYKYMSYKLMRKYLLNERKEFKKYGEYDSGSGLFISVTNGKVVRINYVEP